ncbi:Cell pattern formation-associated protein [Yarrowia sp. C11]|nr:Cell pattern formation-associated protein [Yarrowia sp. E02]KAG5372527.1 Cell pattern formation-associated protein [Yarrowia sp. C11]
MEEGQRDIWYYEDDSQQQQQQPQMQQPPQAQHSQQQPPQPPSNPQNPLMPPSQPQLSQVPPHTQPQPLAPPSRHSSSGPESQAGSTSGGGGVGHSAAAAAAAAQYAPFRARITTTLWEDEGTLCFQVEARGVCVARREDNNMINGTKLLNVVGMTRGRRDGILKTEKIRHVVKIGAMHLKGVWIPYERALAFAQRERIVDVLYPLFVSDIKELLYHPVNYSRTALVLAVAERRKIEQQRLQQLQEIHAGMDTQLLTQGVAQPGAQPGGAQPQGPQVAGQPQITPATTPYPQYQTPPQSQMTMGQYQSSQHSQQQQQQQQPPGAIGQPIATGDPYPLPSLPSTHENNMRHAQMYYHQQYGYPSDQSLPPPLRLHQPQPGQTPQQQPQHPQTQPQHQQQLPHQQQQQQQQQQLPPPPHYGNPGNYGS